VTQPHAETFGERLKRLYPNTTADLTNINAERGPEMAVHLLSSKAITSELHVLSSGLVARRGCLWRAVAQREV